MSHDPVTQLKPISAIADDHVNTMTNDSQNTKQNIIQKIKIFISNKSNDLRDLVNLDNITILESPGKKFVFQINPNNKLTIDTKGFYWYLEDKLLSDKLVKEHIIELKYLKESDQIMVRYKTGCSNNNTKIKTKLTIVVIIKLNRLLNGTFLSKKKNEGPLNDDTPPAKKRKISTAQNPEKNNPDEFNQIADKYLKMLMAAEDMSIIIQKVKEFFTELRTQGNEMWIERLQNRSYYCEPNGPNVSPLILGVMMQSQALIELLLASGADINYKLYATLDTALLAAVKIVALPSLVPSPDIIRFLLENKAKIDVYDNNGNSPLYHAMIKRHDNRISIINILAKEYHADTTNIQFKKGKPHSVSQILKKMKDSGKRDQEIDDYFKDFNFSSIIKSSFSSSQEYLDSLTDNMTKIGKTAVVLRLLDDWYKYNLEIDKVHKINKNNQTLLMLAMKMGDVEVIEKLLTHCYAIPNKQNRTAHTALYIGAFNGRKKAVRFLIDYCKKNKLELNLDKKTNSGATPLYTAIVKNHLDIVKILIQAFLSSNDDHAFGNIGTDKKFYANPLALAKDRSNNEIVQFFKGNFKKNEDGTLSFTGNLSILEVKDNDDDTSLTAALENEQDNTKRGKNKLKPKLSESESEHSQKKKKPSKKAKKKDTQNAGSDYRVFEKEFLTLFQQVLNKTEKINEKDIIGEIDKIVAKAKKNGHSKWIRKFLDKFYDFNGDRLSPLMVMIKTKSLKLVETLTSLQADVNCPVMHSPTKKGIHPLHVAVRFGTPEIVKHLLSKGAKVDVFDTVYATPLYRAFACRDVEMFNILIESGANTARIKINKQNNNILSATQVANGHQQMLDCLKQKDEFDLNNELSQDKFTIAFSNAIQEKGKEAHALKLSEKIKKYPGIDLNTLDIKIPGTKRGIKYSLFTLTAINGDIRLIQELLSKGGNPLQQKEEISFLHLLIINGHVAAVKFLVEYFEQKKNPINKSVGAKRPNNKTPLCEAMISKQNPSKKLGIVKILVEALVRAKEPLGEVVYKNKHYKNPLALAEFLKDKKLVEYFNMNFIEENGILKPKEPFTFSGSDNVSFNEELAGELSIDDIATQNEITLTDVGELSLGMSNYLNETDYEGESTDYINSSNAYQSTTDDDLNNVDKEEVENNNNMSDVSSLSQVRRTGTKTPRMWGGKKPRSYYEYKSTNNTNSSNAHQSTVEDNLNDNGEEGVENSNNNMSDISSSSQVKRTTGLKTPGMWGGKRPRSYYEGDSTTHTNSSNANTRERYFTKNPYTLYPSTAQVSNNNITKNAEQPTVDDSYYNKTNYPDKSQKISHDEGFNYYHGKYKDGSDIESNSESDEYSASPTIRKKR